MDYPADGNPNVSLLVFELVPYLEPECPNFGLQEPRKDPILSAGGYFRECAPTELHSVGHCPPQSFCNSAPSLVSGGVCCPYPGKTLTPSQTDDRGHASKNFLYLGRISYIKYG